jgi:AraC-like DNA-binding protein
MVAPTHSQLIEADERLSTVFSHFYCVQHDFRAPAIEQQLLPNYEMMLVFNFGSAVPARLGDQDVLLEQTAFVGPLQQLLRYTVPPGTDLIVINFTLNGLYRILKLPIQAFTTAPSDWVLNDQAFASLWNQLAALPTLSDRLARITDYLLTSLSPVDSSIDDVLDSLPYFQNPSLEPIKTLSQTQGVSPRSLQLRLRTQFGYSAKQLGRFLRFKQVLSHLQAVPTGTDVDWLDLVSQYGYYDHSHLIKDFSFYLNMTPRQFLQQIAQGTVCSRKPGKFY